AARVRGGTAIAVGPMAAASGASVRALAWSPRKPGSRGGSGARRVGAAQAARSPTGRAARFAPRFAPRFASRFASRFAPLALGAPAQAAGARAWPVGDEGQAPRGVAAAGLCERGALLPRTAGSGVLVAGRKAGSWSQA